MFYGESAIQFTTYIKHQYKIWYEQLQAKLLLPDSELKWRDKRDEEAEIVDRLVERWRPTGLETTNRREEEATAKSDAVARVLRWEETILLHMMKMSKGVWSQVTSGDSKDDLQRFSRRRNGAASGFSDLLFFSWENCSIAIWLGTCETLTYKNF